MCVPVPKIDKACFYKEKDGDRQKELASVFVRKPLDANRTALQSSETDYMFTYKARP